jgi:abhydrolase domain-containing protein 1/3
LVLPDGGEVALDWVLNESSSLPTELRPTVLILPGLVGTSEEGYVRNLAVESMKLGFRTVVFNYRGNGGATLKTSRTYCATETDDLSNVIAHIKKRFDAPIMATGISLGGIILINYLAQFGKSCRLAAAMAVSAPWNTFESARSLEEPINSFIFNTRLAECLKQSIVRHEHLFKDKCDLEKVYSCRTIRDFDDRFTARLFGYDSCESYYHDACIDRKVHDVQVPLLCLNAADDPFSPGDFIPVEEAKKSDNVTIVVTSRGGHIAFLDGMLGLAGRGYVERVFSQFFAAVYHHSGDLPSNLHLE